MTTLGFSVRAVIVEALTDVWCKRRAILQALLFPIAALLAISSATYQFANDLGWILLLSLAELPFYVLFAIACHRIILLGEDELANPWSISWAMRDTRFLGWLIVISIAVVLVISVPAVLSPFASNEVFGIYVPWLSKVPVYVLAAYFNARISLVLPATAVDHRSSLYTSWDLSSGNGTRLAIALSSPILLFSALDYFGSALLGENDSLMSHVGLSLLWLVFSVVAIGILSVSYRRLANIEID
jgi:hypothetical protein